MFPALLLAGKRSGSTKGWLSPGGTSCSVQKNAIPGETEFITWCSWAAFLEETAYAGVRNLWLLFAQVLHKAKGLISKLIWDLISFQGTWFLKAMPSYRMYYLGKKIQLEATLNYNKYKSPSSEQLLTTGVNICCPSPPPSILMLYKSRAGSSAGHKLHRHSDLCYMTFLAMKLFLSWGLREVKEFLMLLVHALLLPIVHSQKGAMQSEYYRYANEFLHLKRP